MDGESEGAYERSSYLGCARQPAAERSEGAIPARRLRPISLCESEHLELLSYNTSDISKYGVDIFNKIFTSVFS